MKTSKNGVVGVLLVVASLLSVACTRTEAEPIQVTSVSTTEAEALWQRADRREALGDAIVQTIADASGVTVVCQQAFRLIGVERGPRPPVLVTCCEGSCKVREGGTLSNCTSDGCLPGERGCSSLACSGSCDVEVTCRPCARGSLLLF